MHNPLHGPAASASDSHVKDAVLIAIAEQLATEEAMIKQAAETEKIMNDIDRYDRAMEQLRSAQRWEKRGWIIPTIILGAIFTALALLAYQNELHRHPSVLRVVRRHIHFVTGELDTTEFGMNGTSLSSNSLPQTLKARVEGSFCRSERSRTASVVLTNPAFANIFSHWSVSPRLAHTHAVPLSGFAGVLPVSSSLLKCS